MELRNIIQILSRRKWIILLTLAVTLILVAIYSYWVKPVYETSTTVRVASASVATGEFNQYLYAERLLNTYAEIASSSSVQKEIMKRLSLDEKPIIEVRVLPGTELMKITVTDGNPTRAANIAVTLDNILIEQSQNFYMGGRLPTLDVINEQIHQVANELQAAQKDYASLSAQLNDDTAAVRAARKLVDSKTETYFSLLTQYEENRVKGAVEANVVSVVDSPQVPVDPIRPQKGLNLLLGLVVGLVGGTGLAFIGDNLDPKFHSARQMEEATGLSTIAEIPKTKNIDKYKPLSGNSPLNRAFQSLRIHLMHEHQEAPMKTILFTSAEKGDGKSTILMNLAYSIAQTGKKVVVVDGNIPSPVLHTLLDCENEFGLSDLLKYHLAPEDIYVRSSIPSLFLIPSGPNDITPANLFDTEEMKTLLQSLREQFDFVLVDSPAIQSEIDAAVVAPFVDAVILVIDFEKARRDTLAAAVKSLGNIQTTIIGMVINKTARSYRSTTG